MDFQEGACDQLGTLLVCLGLHNRPGVATRIGPRQSRASIGALVEVVGANGLAINRCAVELDLVGPVSTEATTTTTTAPVTTTTEATTTTTETTNG